MPAGALVGEDGAPTAVGAVAAACNGRLVDSWSSCYPNATCLQCTEDSTNVRVVFTGASKYTLHCTRTGG
jgi:hypothetical protein